jgi:hypothetical protein
MQEQMKPLSEFDISRNFASLKEHWIMRLHFLYSSMQLDWGWWSVLVVLL